MSGSSEKRITCRQCKEAIPADADNCPHCGTSVRGIRGAIAAVVVGATIFLAAVGHLVVNGESDLVIYGLVGLLVAAVGGYVVYERRQRINEATDAAT
jgi:uncharacterized membrane protein